MVIKSQSPLPIYAKLSKTMVSQRFPHNPPSNRKGEPHEWYSGE